MFRSLSARRAWIEITVVGVLATLVTVALRKESVDRNLVSCINRAVNVIVALRKESVDRNLFHEFLRTTTLKSLSARRAWIELRGFSGG